jgi:hypothetical protein
VQPPLTQRRSPSHTGVAAGQSALVRQTWHVPRRSPASTQRGAAVPQSLSERHAAQRPNVVSQKGVAPEQSLFAVHCTHAPLEGSHFGAVSGHAVVALHAE